MSHSVAFDISGSIVRAAISVRHRPEGQITTAESILIDFLKLTPLLSAPWIFDENERNRQIYCFLFPYDKVRSVLRLGISYVDRYSKLTNQRFLTRVIVMGSQALVFVDQLNSILKSYNETERIGLPPLEAVIIKRKELQCVRDALHYFNQNLASCLYQYKSTNKFCSDAARNPIDTEYVTEAEENGFPMYPYVLVNLKAGISFHVVEQPHGEIRRVGGAPIGFGTFLGLSQLFCGDDYTAYETFLRSDQGEQTRVDMTVADIYGGDYSSVGLTGTMVASTMGKLQRIRNRKDSDDKKLLSSPTSGGGDSDVSGCSQDLLVKPFPSFTLEADGSPRPFPEGKLPCFPSDSQELDDCPELDCSGPARSASIPIKSRLNKSVPFRPLGKLMEINGLTVVHILESDAQMTYTFRDRLTNEERVNEKEEGGGGGGRRHADGGGGGHAGGKRPSSCGDPLHSVTGGEEESSDSNKTMCDFEHEVYKEDIFKSLLSMLTFNVAQLAYLNAELCHCERIILIGYYVDMPETLAAVQHCIQFWSQGKIKVNFVRTAPYLGAIGAALEEARRCR